MILKVGQLTFTFDSNGIRIEVSNVVRKLKCGSYVRYRDGCRCDACVQAWRAWYATNKHKLATNLRNYRKRYPERYKESTKRTYWKDRDADKLKHAIWASNNRDRVKKYLIDWKNNNDIAVRSHAATRRARKLLANGNATTEQVESRMRYYGYKCAYCEGPFEHIEHAIPLSRGGTNWPANLRPSCADCNRRKGSKTILEFLPK